MPNSTLPRPYRAVLVAKETSDRPVVVVKSVEQRLAEADVHEALSDLARAVPLVKNTSQKRDTRDRSEPKVIDTGLLKVDQKISGKLPRPSEEELRGGWRLTEETFLRAARHPQAEIVSAEKPFIVKYKDFLSTTEREHLLELAAGEGGRVGGWVGVQGRGVVRGGLGWMQICQSEWPKRVQQGGQGQRQDECPAPLAPEGRHRPCRTLSYLLLPPPSPLRRV